jgi:O-antigen/teichoic acid export membrane protein
VSVHEDPRSPDAVAENPGRRHIRGSSLLLGGRAVSIGVNLIVQVLTVRYLMKNDYGALAFALSAADLTAMCGALGMDQALARFVPIHREERAYRSVVGAVGFALASTLGCGLLIVTLLWAFREDVARVLELDPHAFAILLLAVSATPVNAMDRILVSLLAVFAGARSVFLRRHLLGPGLKLVAVSTVLLLRGDAVTLVGAHVAAGVVVAAVSALHLLATWRRLAPPGRRRGSLGDVAKRPILSFGLAVLVSNSVIMMRGSAIVLLLGYFHDASSVAAFQVVLPLARVNEVVLVAFSVLFTPIASRSYARNDTPAIDDLYWKAAIWVMVLSFPVFAVCFGLARPLTVLLFGEPYAGSASILAVLSLGYFFQAALGFNGRTLRVLGRVKQALLVDVVGAALAVALALLLVPRLGPLGGAISASAGMVVHGLLKQLCLLGLTDVRPFPRRHAAVYLAVSAGLLLLLVQVCLPLPGYVSACVAGASTILVIGTSARLLEVESTFPELLRVPGLPGLLRAMRRRGAEHEHKPSPHP